MAAQYGKMECKLYPSAFSGEVVFQVSTTTGQSYQGVAPKGYVHPSTKPPQKGVKGQVKVRILSNGGDEARISAPDGQVLTVSAKKVRDET